MTKMNQKEAVYSAVMSVLSQANITLEGRVAKDIMTKEHRATVNAILYEGFRGGKIELGREYTDTELKSYVSGLQTNWLGKDKRLNGNVDHVVKNPGSKTGSTDPQVKALRALLAMSGDADEKAEIQGYLDARLAVVGTKKPKQVKINFDDLPDELKARYEIAE